MREYFRIRNFTRVVGRHEIRLSTQLLNDRRYLALPDNAKALLVGCMLLAIRWGNQLPNEPLTLASHTGTDPGRPDDPEGALKQLEAAGFIEFLPVDDPPRLRPRYVPDKVRAEVFVRDGARCRICRSTQGLEVDHIEPLSKGGENDFSNLQTLCRRCNRRKSGRTRATV